MKKYLLQILLFFAIVFVVDVGIGAFGHYLQGNAKGGSTRQFDDLVMKDQHDVLILGSSRAHSHYDTPFLSDSLACDIYNGGNDGNGIILANGILELVMARYQPKLVLYDVEPAFDVIEYSQDNKYTRYLSHLKPYYHEHCVADIIKDVNLDEWKKTQSGLIRYNTEIIAMAVDNVINRGIEDKGYLPLSGKMNKEPEPKPPVNSKIDSLKLAYVENLIALCQENDVPLILVGSPKYGQKNSEDLQPVKEIAEKNGVRFLDYYADSLFMANKEWFKEPMHLNKEGARVFSKMIAQEIIEQL